MTAENALPSQVTQASGFQETPVSTPESITLSEKHNHPLQQRVSTEFMHLLGSDFTEADALDDFRQRGREFQQLVGSTSADYLNRQVIEGPDYTLASKAAKLKISLTVLAEKHGRNLEAYIEDKLTEKMQKKYHPDNVTEIRFYGTPDNPGKKTGPEALALLKESYDRQEGVQRYEFRGLKIPKGEEDLRVQTRRFSSHIQDLSDWWQTRSLGSDLVISERYDNLVAPKTGEIDEAIAAFEALGSDGNIEEAMYELADVAIGIDVSSAASSVNISVVQNHELDLAVKTYEKGPWLRRLGVGFKERTKFMHDVRERARDGLRPPIPPVPAAASLVTVMSG